MTGEAIDRAMHRTALKGHPLLERLLDGRYRVTELIGRGGRGFVFGAEDNRTRGHVAIKVVTNPEASEAVRRLEREAMLVASLRHPHICSLIDIGYLNEVGPYIVMERLFGETLSHRIRHGGQLPLDVALDLMLQVLSALDAAHAMHVVHRDLKPSNIFVTGRAGMPPIAKVLDFGYARKLDGSVSRLTRPGTTVGTPRYIAPEALLGGELTEQSDLFTCGVLLFEMLTGKRAFRGTTTREIESAVVRGDRRWLLGHRPDAPAALGWLLHHAMSPNPAERVESAREFHFQLRKIAGALRPSLVVVTDEDGPSSIRKSPSQESWQPPMLYEEESSSSSRRGA